ALTVNTATNTPTGSFTLTITGTNGSLSHSTTVALTVSSVLSSGAKPISIHFVGSGKPMGSAEVAGVIAENNWNDAAGASSNAPLALVDSSSSATGVTVTWHSDNAWALPANDQLGNVRMMEGYLDDGLGHPTIVNVAGLPSNANGYTVYVYAD